MKPTRLFATLALTLAFALSASAVEIAGVRLDDTTQVAGAPLKLNGAGIRTKIVFKVYVAGLYLSDKKTAVADVLSAQGPRRMQLVMLRDLSAADFTEALMKGLQNNTSSTELTHLSAQTTQLSQILAAAGNVKKGDTLLLDWLPNEGTVATLNGKRMGAPIADVSFYNALLRIWLGDKPADDTLKGQLLGRG
jgi:hypothetical protein